MSAHNDIDTLRHQLDIIIRSATAIRRQLHDLHSIAYEPGTSPAEKVRKTKTDYVPRVLDEAPASRHTWERLEVEVKKAQEKFVGLERAVFRHFTAGTSEPTRGSLIRPEEHAEQLDNQRARQAAGEYTPARLMDQPPHYGNSR